MTYKSFVAGIVLSLCLLLSWGAPAVAQAARGPVETAALADEQVIQRLEFLDRQFESQQSSTALWEYGWGAFNGGSMIFSTVQAATTNNRKDRDMNIVQSVEGLIGVADIIFRPLPVFNATSGCPQNVTTPEARMQCLAAKEDLAQRSAERADEPYQILPHVETLGINLLAGGLVWALAGVHRGLITAVPGMLIGEIQLWTTPGQPADDYKRYQVQFSPMVSLSSQKKDPVLGLTARWRF